LRRHKGTYAYRHWRLNWTLRSVAATGVFATAAVASAYGATLALDDVRRADASLRAEATELQLLAEYAAFMARETAEIRDQYRQSAIDGPSVLKYHAPRALAYEDAAIEAMVDVGFDDLRLARHAARERQCMAEAIYFEARSEKRIGQLAVADVIMNRVKSSIYPDSVCDVIYQGAERVTGCQFSFTCDGSMEDARLTTRNRQWRAAQDLAGTIMAGLHKPVSRSATHYHADYVSPPWAANLTPTATIGTHKFYRFKNRTVRFAAPAGM